MCLPLSSAKSSAFLHTFPMSSSHVFLLVVVVMVIVKLCKSYAHTHGDAREDTTKNLLKGKKTDRKRIERNEMKWTKMISFSSLMFYVLIHNTCYKYDNG